jgi:protein-S-isoprenylcysteine O-methyltransferase Ste14
VISAADARIKAMRSRARRVLPKTLIEEITLAVALLLGLFLVIYGIGRIYSPAAFITAGLLFSAIALGYLRGKQ